MIWIMAWRNIWRHRRRTLITASGLALGITVMSWMFTLSDGFVDRMIRVVTASRIGEAQIHAHNYLQTQDETLLIKNVDDLLSKAEQLSEIAVATPRVLGMGVLSIADRSRGVHIMGIDINREKQATNWEQRLLHGHYIAQSNHIMLGVALAKKLDIEVGSKILITAANIYTGEPITELVWLTGILNTGDAQLDRQTVIIDLKLSQKMLGVTNQAHEITLRLSLDDRRDQVAIEQAIKPLESTGLVVESWHELNKMIAQVSRMMSTWLDAVVYFLFMIIAFGVVNTISMSLLERKIEFGVMRALGGSGKSLAGLVVIESMWLGVVGAIPGIILGLAISEYTAVYGYDFTGTTAYGMTFTEPVYGKVNVWGTVHTAIIFTLLTTLTSLLSAFRASRIDPVEAMRG
jgi:putative ABC transport system permease protein